MCSSVAWRWAGVTLGVAGGEMLTISASDANTASALPAAAAAAAQRRLWELPQQAYGRNNTTAHVQHSISPFHTSLGPRCRTVLIVLFHRSLTVPSLSMLPTLNTAEDPEELPEDNGRLLAGGLRPARLQRPPRHREAGAGLWDRRQPGGAGRGVPLARPGGRRHGVVETLQLPELLKCSLHPSEAWGCNERTHANTGVDWAGRQLA